MKEDIEKIRHSVSHIMAASVKKLFPDAKFGIGPTIENGFYYDFDLPRSLTPEDLPKIEKEMLRLIKQNLPFEKFEVPYEKAIQMAETQPFKKELIGEIKEKNEPISF